MTVEAFVLATRLTRLTRVLRSGGPDAALPTAGATAEDCSGGTRIGRSLSEFNDRSGWEMERLGLAYRIVWGQPSQGRRRLRALVGGMAVPRCDAVVSGHGINALQELVDAIASPA